MAADPIQAAIDRAREADDRDAVFAALSPHRDRLGDDRRLAYVWAEALRTSPKRPTLRDEARAILEAWPHEPALVGRVADALLRADERPLDEPPLDPQGALLAAGALDRCSGALDPEAARDPEIGGRLLAQRAHALRLLGPGRHDEAVTLLERAIALDPDRAQWHFELGLLHKHRRDFASMRASAEHAARLEPSRGALFNLAIAATAAGDAALAKDAWDRLGIATTVREGGLPMASELAPVKVRLATRGSGLGEDALPEQAASFEAVWVQPMSPCHGVVRSATVRDAVADFGDVVLFDAAPVAILEHEGRKVPCLPLLGVLRAGGELRCRFAAMQQRDGQLEALGEALPEGARLLATAHRIERVCPRCAAGETLTKHEHLPAEEHRIVYGKLIVSEGMEPARVAEALETLRDAHSGVLLAVPGLYEALGDTPRAGKHHQRWGAIERAVGARGGA